MNPDPEIYGSPESWHNCYYGGGSTQPWAALVHGEKAKVPTWSLTNPGDAPTFVNSQLRSAVADNKLTPTQPIDNSICAVGQGRSSPFRKFAVYANRETTQASNGEIIQIGHAYTGANFNDNESPINTFWYEANCSSSYGLYANGAFSSGRLVIRDGATITQGLDQRIWSPTGVNEHGTKKQNGNFYIAPFMSYGTRTYVLQIWVYVTSADYDAEYAGNVPNGNWRTLDDWKINYPTKAITGCLLRVRSISSYDASAGIIGYYGINFGSSDYRKVACGILDTMKFELDDGTTLPELTSYGLFSTGSNSDIGVSLFNGLTNIYKWSDTLQQIAIVPEYISQYIKTNGTSMFPYIPYSDDIYDWIMESCACFGMAFTPAKSKGTDSSNCRFNQNFTDADLCLPIIDSNGIAHGDYTRGADNVNNDFINLSSQWDKNYTPSAPIDTNTYSNITGFNSVSAGASATERYVLDAGNTRQLLSDLWTISHDIAGVDYDNYNYKILDSFLVSNPIDSIISLKRFPFNIPHTFSNSKTPVNLGKNHGSAQGYLTYNAFNSVQFAGINIFPRFGNSFLDYAPYTEYELYVPFCGTVKLNAGDILGHTLNCRLQIDLITGACTAYIMADSLVIETMTGTVSCELALTGIDSATIDANIQNSVLNHVNARTNKEVSMLSPMTVGGLIGAASNPFKTAGSIATAKTETQRAEYELTHIQTSPHTMGSAGGLTGWCQEFNARLMIYYPEGDVITNSIPPGLTNLANYGHTTGFATIDNTTLSNYSGFTVATNAILNFAATDTEKEMITSLLQSGVYL